MPAPAQGLARQLDHDPAIGGLVADGRVGRQDDHYLVVGSIDRGHGQGDGRCRIAAGRLGDDPDTRELGRDEAAIPPIGNDGDRVVGAEELTDPGGRPLHERLIAEEREERLGPLGRAERPQAGASPAG